MRFRTTPIAIFILILVVCCAAPAVAADATTVFLARHAEKATGSSDPELTEGGRRRAEELARVLADAGIDAVYSTPFARTRQTAAAVAKVLGLEVGTTPIEAGQAARHPDDVARMIREKHAGQRVLVVGHSNTVPGIAASLGAEGVPALTEADYDDLFVVTVDGSGTTDWLHLHYGAKSP